MTHGVGECKSKVICSEIHVSFFLILLVFLLTWSGVARLSQRLCTGSSMNRILRLIQTSMMLLPNLFRSTFLENLEVSDWFRRWWTLFWDRQRKKKVKTKVRILNLGKFCDTTPWNAGISLTIRFYCNKN